MGAVVPVPAGAGPWIVGAAIVLPSVFWAVLVLRAWRVHGAAALRLLAALPALLLWPLVLIVLHLACGTGAECL
jgi:hypothetical protein